MSKNETQGTVIVAGLIVMLLVSAIIAGLVVAASGFTWPFLQVLPGVIAFFLTVSAVQNLFKK